MRSRLVALVGLLLIPLLSGFSVLAQEPKAKTQEVSRDVEDEKPVATRHEVQVGGKVIHYTATAGFMPLHDSAGKLEARLFYVAYIRDDAGGRADRRLTFAFNGGPGSSSVWLHLGALGPRRVAMPEDPVIPAPPFHLVENEDSWIDQTDLVFIDPVETGYSRAVKPELNKKFHGLEGDIESIGRFIRLYLARTERWTSPLYLVGESYGTTRAAGLTGHLADEGIAFNGIVLVSTVLDFQTIRFSRTNDLPFALFLPSYTATAWYHKRLPADLQQADLRDVLTEVERWAETEYLTALTKGDRLSAEERTVIVKRLARYTGLEEQFLDLNDLRVNQSQFCREIVRDQRRTLGRFDSRYEGIALNPGGAGSEFDPSEAAVRPAYTATFNQYVRTELGYKVDTPYHILGGGQIGAWDWGTSGFGYPETGGSLRTAMAKNPQLKVLVASGDYDLATPYAATDYTLAHMRLDPALRSRIHVERYAAGHMMYLHHPSLTKLKKDAVHFFEDAERR